MIGDEKLREVYKDGVTIYDGKIIKVEKWRVTLPDGREAAREVVIHNGAAAVVPVDAQGNVTLVRQHRVVLNTFTWEIPAGKLDSPDEDTLDCAKRELEEETGLRATTWRKLNHVISTPGFCTEKIGLYLATGLTQHEAHADQDEFLRLMKIPLSEAVRRVMAGEFKDAKTCLGLLMAQQILSEQVRMPKYGDGLPPYMRKAQYPTAKG